MIILDFETNSANEHDVIEAAAFRVQKISGRYEIQDEFHRYYFSRYPVNMHAFEVHKLSPSRIAQFRGNDDCALYFNEDDDFVEFCKGAKTLVAHNLPFEKRHLNGIVEFENYLCTMKENKAIVGAVNKNNRLKNPRLDETCYFYGIDFDQDSYHSAIYDITKTLQILNRMDV